MKHFAVFQLKQNIKFSFLFFITFAMAFAVGCRKDPTPPSAIEDLWKIDSYYQQNTAGLTFGDLPVMQYTSVLFNANETGMLYGKISSDDTLISWNRKHMTTDWTMNNRGFYYHNSFSIQVMSKTEAKLVERKVYTGFVHEIVVILKK